MNRRDASQGKVVGRLVILFLWVVTGWESLAFTPANLKISLDRPFEGYAFKDAWPGIRFEQPVAVASVPGETNRVFVVERRGIIWAVTNFAQPTKSVFLDLSAKTIWDVPYNESGMLGLAFHPGFVTNGYFFVYRVVFGDANYGRDTLSRFSVSSARRDQGDPASESILFSMLDISSVHNAGDLHFGADGYLYFSIGSDGPVPVPIRPTQQIDNGLFGGIFRIDVDNRPENLTPNPHPDITPGAYKVPRDNPFVGATTFMGAPIDVSHLRGEYFATGLRNPWRFTIDPATGDIYAGDVGEQTFEEVNLIQAGKNYGWPFVEGNWHHIDTGSAIQFTEPLYFWTHGMATNQGTAAIGGLVVHNTRYPGLDGAYLYGDFGSGNVWKLRRTPSVSVEWVVREPGLAAFGLDPSNGDVLIINVGEGTIRRLIYTDASNSSVPAKLSQTGIFSDLKMLTPTAGFQPFEINVPFWSDGAIKQRWFGITDPTARFGFVEDSAWTLPRGAVWVKHFELEMVKGDATSRKRLETRVLFKDADDIYGYTYRWGDSVTEAQLVPSSGMDEIFNITDGETVRQQTWHYPGRGECHACHSRNAGFAAGFYTAQLNVTATHGAVTMNELTRIADMGYMDRGVVNTTQLRKLAGADDQTQPIEHRVKSLFASNCSMCHRPEGLPIKARWDARLTTPMDSEKIIGGPISQGFTGSPLEQVVHWRDVTNSVLLQRMLNFDVWTYHMPPFGSTVVNQSATTMLAQWINTLPDPAWTRGQIGSAPLFGSIAEDGNTLTIGGAGLGVGAPDTESHYTALRDVRDNFSIVTRITAVPGLTPGLQAGVMIRQSAGTNLPFAAVLRDASGQNSFVVRGSGEVTLRRMAGAVGNSASWQRIICEGDRVSGWESVDGQNWSLIGSDNLTEDMRGMAGFTVASGDPWQFATVQFDNYSIASLAMSLPSQSYLLPASVPVSADLDDLGMPIQRVDFYAGDQLIGSDTQAPWGVNWTNAVGGVYDLSAVAIAPNGLCLTSGPVAMSLISRPASALYYGSQDGLGGNWSSQFGGLGYAVPLMATNLSGRGQVASLNAQMTSWTPAPTPGLQTLDGGLIASAWTQTTQFSIVFNPAFEDPYRLTLFLADYAREGAQLLVTLLALDGQVLDQRIEESLAAGRFVTWTAHGGIEIRVRSLNTTHASLSGLFLDVAPPPRISIQLPNVGAAYVLPAPILISTDASADGSPLDHVDFYSDGAIIGSVTRPPYEFTWTNAFAGNHSLSTVAAGRFGLNGTSAPVSIRCDLPLTHATFLGVNGLAKGDWWKAFGADGFETPLGLEQFRPFARVGLDPSIDTYMWQSAGTDTRGTRLPGTETYLATCWHSDLGINVSVDFLDGREHTIAFYFLDFDRVGAAQTIRLLDADTQAVLSEYVTDDMGEGIYLSWKLQGRALLQVARNSGWNAILSGIFAGDRVQSSQFWWARHFGGDLLADPNWADDPDGDGRNNLMEYAFGTDPQSTDTPLILQTTMEGSAVVIHLDATQKRFDANLTLEMSSDLVNWSAAPATRQNSDAAIEFSTPIAGSSRYFRLRVNPP